MAQPLVAWRPGVLMGGLMRMVRGLYRALFQRRLPYGLLHWRYVLPGQDERVRLHRHLWWQSLPGCPRLIWLPIEFGLRLRWVGFSGWRSCWLALRQWGCQVKARHGISRWQQGRQLIALSIGSCVPPRDVYRFHLYLEPDRRWDFVFDHEIHAYHRWRSRPLGPGQDSRALLADKLRLTEALTAMGVPMAPILACVSRGQGDDLTTWLAEGERLFCKTRSGSRGIGAFTVWQCEGVIQGRRFCGDRLLDVQAVSQAWRELLKRDAGLIQPALPNHPQLAPLAVGDDAITVRYISCWDKADNRCLSAVLEIPAGYRERSGQRLYVILPIEPASGAIHPVADSPIPGAAAQKRYAAVFARLPSDLVVPGWPLLAEISQQAHRRFPDLWAVAWDWVVTPEGPRLLEGNSNWDGNIPQCLHGGFLQRDRLCNEMNPSA